MVPVFSPFDYISPGPHINCFGRMDNRVWFYIQVAEDGDKGTITYLKFPYGGEDHEIIEEEVSAIWTD